MWWILALLACGGADSVTTDAIALTPQPTAPRIETQVVAMAIPETTVLPKVVFPEGEVVVRNCPVVETPPPPQPTARRPPMSGAGASESASAASPPQGLTSANPGAADTVASRAATKPSSPSKRAPNPATGTAGEGIALPDAEAVVGGRERGTLGGEPRAAEADEPLEPQWDFGARLHLSNDDSMSLASAQRVLWNAMNQRRPSTSQIRPHELLNYFTFQTVPVPEGQTFSVLGSAESDADVLTVALAIQGETPKRQPLDLTLAIDRSCSMEAEGRAEYTRRGLTQMAEQLQPGDRVDVVMFSSDVCTPLENWVKGRDDEALLHDAIATLVPDGGTDLDRGLRTAYGLQAARSADDTADRNRRVMLITDAQLNVGNVDADLFSEIGSQLETSGIRLTGIGVGRDFRDDVLNKLTEKGKGAYVYLGSEAVVDRVFGSGFNSLTQTVAHDVRFSIQLPQSLALQRFYGEEVSTDAADIQPIHYYAGTSQVFLQDLHIGPDGLVLDDPLTLNIAWTDAESHAPRTLELTTTVGALLDGDPVNVRKGQALMKFSDVMSAWAMHQRPCSAPLASYVAAASKVVDDAEIDFLNRTLDGLCGSAALNPETATVKVQFDSDRPVQRADLQCGDQGTREGLSPSDTIAQFKGIRQGSRCALTAVGPGWTLQQALHVPQSDLQVRCTIRAGAMTCG